MTIQEAIKVRHSVRQYTEQPIEAEKIQQLQELIDQCNRKGNLHIQLVTDEPNAFSSIIAHYSKFRGVRNYIAMICKKGKSINMSLSSTEQVEVSPTGEVICEFHDRERLWNILFDIDLVLWVVSWFVQMPPLYKILSDAFFVIWIVRLVLIRKKYYRIMTTTVLNP